MTSLRFSFDKYASALSNQLKIEHESSFVMAITGEWGCGKTTLMNSVINSLPAQQFIKVNFNAWKYTQEEALWRAFFAAIIQELRIHISKQQVRSRNQWVEDDIELCNSLFDETERSLYSAFTLDIPGEITIDAANLAKGGAKLALKFVPWSNFGVDLLDKFLVAKDDDGSPIPSVVTGDDIDLLWGVLKRSNVKRTVDKLTSIEQFHESMKTLIHAVLHGDYNSPSGKSLKKIPDDRRYKIVVAVDDLDRCLPEQSLEILESIKLFLDMKDTYFILAMDQDMIQNALDLRYKNKSNQLDRPQILARQYTEKMISLTFSIPSVSQVNFLDFIAGDLPNGASLAKLYDVLSIAIPNNIRAWKRFSTRAMVNQEIVNNLQDSSSINNGDLDLFLKFQCLAYRWPEVFNRIGSLDVYRAIEECMIEVHQIPIPSETKPSELAHFIKRNTQSHSKVPDSVWERIRERALCHFIATPPLLSEYKDANLIDSWFSLDVIVENTA